MKNIKGIMFDMGGTLIDDNGLSFNDGFTNVYNHFVYKRISLDEFLKFINELLKDTIYCRTNFDLKCIDLIKFVLNYLDEKLDCPMDKIEEYFSYGFSRQVEIEGIRSLLEQYKKDGLKLIVLSNTFLSSKEITRRLEEVDLRRYFSEIIASSDYLVRKPSKFFFEYGLKEIGLNKDEVIYVGNSYNFDVLGCENSCLDIVFYNKYHYNEYDFSNLKIKVKEIKEYKELEGLDLCQIF